MNMSGDDKYALNWGEHANHIKHSFDTILKANDFVDVTLSCEGKKLKAHRVILSACSTFFYDLLKDNPCPHPTIVLRDMSYKNIQYMLKFMYCGEVEVPTANFGTFLHTAELLKVSGLSGDNNAGEPEKKVKHDKEEVSTKERSKSPSKLTSVPTARSSVHPSNKRKISVEDSHKRRISVDDEPSFTKKKKEVSESEDDLSDAGSKDEDGEVATAMSMESKADIQKLLEVWRTRRSDLQNHVDKQKY